MRKFFVIFLLFLACVYNTAFAEDNSKIKKEIYSSITEIYGKNNADEIYNKVIEQADKAILNALKNL